MEKRTRSLGAAWLLAIALAACGPAEPAKAPPEPATPALKADVAPANEPDPSELAGLERDLEVAERHVEVELERKRSEDQDRARELPPPAPPPAPRDPTARDRAEPTTEPTPRRAPSIGAPCDVACRALRTMDSAVERICTLTHEGHARCQAARGRLNGAKARIAEAGCGCLSPGRPS